MALMADSAEAPAAKRARTDADVPESEFEVGDIVVLEPGAVDSKGNYWTVAVKIRRVSWYEGEWYYRYDLKGEVESRKGVFAAESQLKEPKFAVGERVGLVKNGNGTNNGEVMGDEIDDLNRLRYKILWDDKTNLEVEITKFDE